MRVPCCILALIAAAPAASAQDPIVLQRASGAIRVDGDLSDPGWRGIRPLGGVQVWPTKGAAPSETTEFLVAYDDDYLYAACRNADREPHEIRMTSLRRDDDSQSNDWCGVNLDTFNDEENALVFGVTPAGVRTDGVWSPEGWSNTWNTFWDAAARTDAEGWSAEIRIPLSSIRFKVAGDRVTMGMVLWRGIARRNEFATFPEVTDRWGRYSLFRATTAQDVVLEGVRNPTPLYLTPYALGGGTRTQVLDGPGIAYTDSNRYASEAGLDFKVGLTSNLTLDATVNTDFAQVEADDQQVNLTRFSLFFPEKRLFFQERSTTFDFPLGAGSERLFYSRRIGLVDGQPVRLYGGARIVGRLGDWDLGLMNMHADAPAPTGAENFGVFRLRRRMLNANSYLGGMVTTRIGADGSRNIAAGTDATVRVAGENYLTMAVAGSDDRADPAGQRLLDRTFARVQLERRGEYGVLYRVEGIRAGAAFAPGSGFIQRRDYALGAAAIGWGQAIPTGALLRVGARVEGSAFARNADQSVETAELRPQVTLTGRAGYSITLAGALTYDDVTSSFALSPDAAVPAGAYTFQAVSLQFSPAVQSALRTGVTLEGGSFYDGTRITAGLTPTWNVSPKLSFTGSYRVNRIRFGDRGERFTSHVTRLRVQVTLNTALSFAAVTQYNSAADIVVTNVRLRYNPREGVDLYVVVNEGRNTDREREVPILPAYSDRTLLLKYAHTFRLTF